MLYLHSDGVQLSLYCLQNIRWRPCCHCILLLLLVGAVAAAAWLLLLLLLGLCCLSSRQLLPQSRAQQGH